MEETRSEELPYRSEKLLRRVFDSMSSGVLVIGPNGEVELANRSALAFLGLDAPIDGTILHEVVPDLRVSRIGTTSNEQTELTVALRDGTIRLFGFTATAVEGQDRTVMVFRDITLTVEGRERKRRAEELALVGEMLSRLSHEINNPLASILVGIKALQRGTDPSCQHGQILRLISQEVDSLTKTVNQLIESTRWSPVSPKPTSVESLMERCMDGIGVLALRRGVELELVRTSASCDVIVDGQALLRVLESIVQNAVDACAKGDVIRIGWRVLDESEKHELLPGFPGRAVALFVHDTGPGIPDELCANPHRIFQPFVSTKVSGSGLGLTVARDLVESLGGVILVASRPKQGTRVDILLPCPDAIPCWDRRRDRSEGRPFTQDNDCMQCDLRSTGTGHCCWMFREHGMHSDTDMWPKRCLNCGFFRSSNLTPFFRSQLLAPGREGNVGNSPHS